MRKPLLSSADMSSIISGHQDLYASRFCGHGLPDWTITRDASTAAFPRPVKGFRAASYDAEGADGEGLPADGTCQLGEKAGQDDWGLCVATLARPLIRQLLPLFGRHEGLLGAVRERARTSRRVRRVLGARRCGVPRRHKRHRLRCVLLLFTC